MDPGQCVLDPVEVALPFIVEDAQCDQIHTRRHSGMNHVLTANDARHVRAVCAPGSVVVGVGVVFFGEVPSADDLIRRTEAAAQGDVIVGDARVDDDDGLSFAGESVGGHRRAPAGHLMRVDQLGTWRVLRIEHFIGGRLELKVRQRMCRKQQSRLEKLDLPNLVAAG